MYTNNTKKRVLIYSMAYYPLIGGAEIAVKEITQRISDIEWTMVTRRFDDTHPAYEKIGAIDVYRVRCPKIFFPFIAFWKGKQLYKEKQFDMVWAVMTYAGFAALFLKLSLKKILFFLNLQEGTPFADIKRKAFFVYPLFRLMFKKADVITALSQFLAHMAHDIGATHAVVVPNGVDLSLFATEPPREKVISLARTLGKRDDDIYLTTVSRLSHKNGVDDLIRSLQYLPEHIKLLIAGVGEDEYMLKRMADTLGVRDRVVFLGLVNQTDIPVLLRISDIFVRASRSEGFGISFIEAMAAGLPVVATPVGGIPDFIDDRETGMFVCPDNPKSIAEAINELIERDDLRNHIAIQGQKRVCMRYSWDTIVPQMNEHVFDMIRMRT